MADPAYDKDALAVIGAIIVCWGHIEKQVASSVQSIEMANAIATSVWPPNYTDLGKLRGFKARKGHLRNLVEKHGTKEQLKALDQIYKKLIEPRNIRHSLSHDLVSIMPKDAGIPDQKINILNLGNLAAGKMPEVAWKTVGELQSVFAKMRSLPVEILRISGDIRILPHSSRKKTP